MITDAQRDKYLRKTYGIELGDYLRRLKAQGGGCAICGKRPARGKNLHVDHDHKARYIKIATMKQGRVWLARASYRGLSYEEIGDTKNLAIQVLRYYLKAASVRGLLCSRCNRGLRWYYDLPASFRAAAIYLEVFNGAGVSQVRNRAA